MQCDDNDNADFYTGKLHSLRSEISLLFCKSYQFIFCLRLIAEGNGVPKGL